MPKISALTPDTDPLSTDYIPFVDTASTPATKRVTLSSLLSFIFNQVNIPSGSGSPVTRENENGLNHAASGCIWTADNAGVNRNASMTTGIVYINGRRISITSVTGRTFTASKDTYVDVLDNLDGTGTLVYTEVANGVASPALASNSLRIAIVITGASAIAATTGIIQVGLDSLNNQIYCTRRAIMFHKAATAAVSGSAYFPDAATSLVSKEFVVPVDYAGGDLRIRLFVRGGGLAGNVRWSKNSFRFRLGSAFSQIDTNVLTTQAAIASAVTWEVTPYNIIAASNIQVGDVIRIDISRLGTDGADTSTDGYDIDGFFVEYRSKTLC